MRTVTFALVVGMCLCVELSMPDTAVAKPPSRSDAGAATYERLATTIIAIRETENSLVSEILNNYRQLADDHLRAAQGEAKDRAAHLEAAADEVANIANEGNKAVQAVRQRLAQAGHSHHSDADTKDDYMFVNSKEKKELLALAKKIAQLTPSANAEQIASVRKELDDLFAKCMAPK